VVWLWLRDRGAHWSRSAGSGGGELPLDPGEQPGRAGWRLLAPGAGAGTRQSAGKLARVGRSVSPRREGSLPCERCHGPSVDPEGGCAGFCTVFELLMRFRLLPWSGFVVTGTVGFSSVCW